MDNVEVKKAGELKAGDHLYVFPNFHKLDLVDHKEDSVVIISQSLCGNKGMRKFESEQLVIVDTFKESDGLPKELKKQPIHGGYPDETQNQKLNRIEQMKELNLMRHDLKSEVIETGLLMLTHVAHGNVSEAGWWDEPDTKDTVPVKLCLIHSEVSEAMEGDRKDLMDDKLPHRKMLEVELADAVIRIADLAGRKNLDLAGAILEKMEFNKKRPDHKRENRQKDGGKTY